MKLTYNEIVNFLNNYEYTFHIDAKYELKNELLNSCKMIGYEWFTYYDKRVIPNIENTSTYQDSVEFTIMDYKKISIKINVVVYNGEKTSKRCIMQFEIKKDSPLLDKISDEVLKKLYIQAYEIRQKELQDIENNTIHYIQLRLIKALK